MAMTPKERNEKLKDKRVKFAEKELRHRVRPGIEEALKRVRARTSGMNTSELLQVAIMKMDLMIGEDLAEFVKYPRHEIMVSEDVAREIYDHGVRSIMNISDQDESDEVVAPRISVLSC